MTIESNATIAKLFSWKCLNSLKPHFGAGYAPNGRGLVGVCAVNSNPNAAQKAYQDELRDMYFARYAGRGQIHHIFGSKAKFKAAKEAGIARPGEWLVILLADDVHENIGDYSFEAERGLFLQQQREYEQYFGKPSPVPTEIVQMYKNMRHRQDITGGVACIE